jgi:OOP family OmpA-OmpF porin
MKIKSTLTLAVLLGSLGCMGSANAADPVTGFYLGGSLGMATTTGSNNSGVTMTDKTDQALSVRAGYRIHTNWAVEGGYADLGKSKYKYSGYPEGTLKTNLWHLDAVGILPLVDKFSVFGKLGIAQLNYDDGGDKFNKTTPHIGVGVSYAILPALALRAEYDNYGKAKFTDGTYSSELSSSQFSLGMDYRF